MKVILVNDGTSDDSMEVAKWIYSYDVQHNCRKPKKNKRLELCAQMRG